MTEIPPLRVQEAHRYQDCTDRENCWARDLHYRFEAIDERDEARAALSAAEARVETLQRQVEAIYSRRIEQLAANEQAAAELQADIDRCDATGVWDAAGNPGTRARAIDRERDYLHAALGDLRQILALAAVPGKPQPTEEER